MTPRRDLRASRRRSISSSGSLRLHVGQLDAHRALLASVISLAAFVPAIGNAQVRGEAPQAPATALGPTTAAPTISVLGLASSSNTGGAPLAQRGELWLGATQPLGRFGNVRFNAIGHADIHTSDGTSSNNTGEGMLALRARARFSSAQVWGAYSYGYVRSNGKFAPPNVNMGPGVTAGFDGARVDTTVSQHVDVGAIQRAEGGVISNLSGIEFSFGLAVDRISRVTTKTITIDQSSMMPPTAMSADGRTTTVQSTRSLQRREIATGIASMGFLTGPATWLISVTSPLATRVMSDALSPKPRIAPTIASVAIMQPVTGWLSLVGAAATNSSSVGSTVFRDDVGSVRHGNFAPVVAVGVRIARLPFFGHGDDTPSGILSFESRIIGSVDSASVNQVDNADGTKRDTLRVVMWIDAPKAESVELMGDATQWTVTAMSRSGNGRWRAELKLPPGVHRITVRTDGGKWIAPPSLPLGNDDYGTPVGMIIVRGGR